MATNSEMIKEFLVGLGFQIDESSLKKFDSGIANATKNVERLAAGVVALATTIEAFVIKASDSLEKLYFTAQRTNSLVDQLQSTSLAIRNMGGTAEGASSAIENLANAMRFNPGVNAQLQALGVPFQHLGNATAVIKDLAGIFRTMPLWQARAFANVFGIDDRTLLSMLNGADKLDDVYTRLYKRFGVNADAAAASGHRFMVQLRELLAYMEVAGTKLQTTLEPFAERFLRFLEFCIDGLQRLSQVHPVVFDGLIAGAVAVAAALFPVTTAITAISAAVLLLVDDFEAWREGSAHFFDWAKGWHQIQPIIEALKGLGSAFAGLWDVVKPVLEPMIHLAADFLKVLSQAALAGITGLIKALTDVINLITLAISKLENSAAGKWLGRKLGIYYTAAEDAMTVNQPANENYPRPLPVAPSVPSGVAPRGIRNNNPGNLRFWAGAGNSEGYATFNSPLEGLGAMTANLLKYGSRGWDSIAQIVNHWAPSSDRNNVPAYEAALSKFTGFGINDKLNMRDPRTLQLLEQGIIRQENGFNPYDTALISQAISSRLGGVTITQHNEYNISSTESAAGVAKAISGEQAGTNNMLVRNVKGAMR